MEDSLRLGRLAGEVGAAAVVVAAPYYYDLSPDELRRYFCHLLSRLEPPDLDRNPHFERLMEQVEWIARAEGRVTGFVNWQGVLNNAHRLRGEQLFLDLVDEPDQARHLFACVTQTMCDGILRLHERQRASGADYRFVTVSNCLVNLVSPAIYQEFLLPCDQRLAALYGCIGIHNCAWNATPYLDSYARVPGGAYLDMGADTDLALAKSLFPESRRAVILSGGRSQAAGCGVGGRGRQDRPAVGAV